MSKMPLPNSTLEPASSRRTRQPIPKGLTHQDRKQVSYQGDHARKPAIDASWLRESVQGLRTTGEHLRHLDYTGCDERGKHSNPRDTCFKQNHFVR